MTKSRADARPGGTTAAPPGGRARSWRRTARRAFGRLFADPTDLSGVLRDGAPGPGAADLLAAAGVSRDPIAPEDGSADEPARRWSPGREEVRKARIGGRRRWYAGAAVGLSFLVVAMVQAATAGSSLTDVLIFEALAVCFAVVYLMAPVRLAGGGMFVDADGYGGRKTAVLAVMIALTVPMIVVGGTGVTALWIYVGVVAAIMFRLRVAAPLALALAAAMIVVSAVAGDPVPWELALTLVALSLWMAGFVGNIRLTIELRATRAELARSAVAAERARIGRDLHDILGHSLTAIAVKAGLARRLAGRDADRAAAEVADIERLARDALGDVRATAAGYRDVSLAAELALARSVLGAAGIEADLPTAVDDVGESGRRLFGYVVREAVTNVVRHSGARRCTIVLEHDRISITDDGDPGRRVPGGPPGRSARDGSARSAPTGSGLGGLAERVRSAGGEFRAGPRPAGGFEVVAALPPTGADR